MNDSGRRFTGAYADREISVAGDNGEMVFTRILGCGWIAGKIPSRHLGCEMQACIDVRIFKRWELIQDSVPVIAACEVL